MSVLRITTILVVFASLFFSCTKTKEVAPSEEDLLIGKSWKVSAYTSYNNVVGVSGKEEEYAQLADCEKDNIFTFQRGNKYTIAEGLTKCADEDPQQMEEGYWRITGKKLTFTDSGIPIPFQFDILELSKQTLKIKMVMQDPDSEKVSTKIITFTAQ